MDIIKDITRISWKDTAVTLGKFDGIHLGHRLLIQKVLEAEKEGCTPTVFTFDRFPARLLLKQNTTSILLEKEKQELFNKMGLQRYVLFPFHEQTASMEPEQFVEEILVKRMKVKKLFVGSDFRFGKGRRGDVALLEHLSGVYGFDFEQMEKKMYKGAEVSSTRIRESIANGKMEDVTAMLGIPYALSGKVVHGKNLGHTIGIPTINQSFPEGKVMPALGVYCAKVTIEGKNYYGLANIGSKPTVQDELIYGIETHLFQCTENLYGKTAKTELLHFVRPERKFPSVDELIQQLEADKLYGRNYFKL